MPCLLGIVAISIGADDILEFSQQDPGPVQLFAQRTNHVAHLFCLQCGGFKRGDTVADLLAGGVKLWELKPLPGTGSDVAAGLVSVRRGLFLLASGGGLVHLAPGQRGRLLHRRTGQPLGGGDRKSVV